MSMTHSDVQKLYTRSNARNCASNYRFLNVVRRGGIGNDLLRALHIPCCTSCFPLFGKRIE